MARAPGRVESRFCLGPLSGPATGAACDGKRAYAQVQVAQVSFSYPWVRTGPPSRGVAYRLGSSIIKTAFPPPKELQLSTTGITSVALPSLESPIREALRLDQAVENESSS